jgi:hypothetical protein
MQWIPRLRPPWKELSQQMSDSSPGLYDLGMPKDYVFKHFMSFCVVEYCSKIYNTFRTHSLSTTSRITFMIYIFQRLSRCCRRDFSSFVGGLQRSAPLPSILISHCHSTIFQISSSSGSQRSYRLVFPYVLALISNSLFTISMAAMHLALRSAFHRFS